jgi:prolyl oligopeptidase
MDPLIEIIHGVHVTDPYRWLEDGESRRTRDWLEEQNAYARGYLTNIPGRHHIEHRIREFLEVETYDSLLGAGQRYVFRKRLPDQEQPSIYIREGLDGPDRLLIEPPDHGAGKYTAVKPLAISHDGQTLAYEVKEGGEQASRVELLNLLTGCRLPDALPHGYLRAFAFAPDSLSFYYSIEPVNQSESFARVLRQHWLGERPEQDRTIFDAGTASNIRIGLVSGPKSQLIFVQKFLDRVLIDCYLRSHDGSDPTKLILNNIDYMFAPQFVDDRILALTDLGAPNLRIVELLLHPSGDHEFVELVSSQRALVQQWTVLPKHMVLSYVEGTSLKICIFDLFGKPLGEVPLTEGSTVRLIAGCGLNDEVMFTCESFFQSTSIHKYSITSKELSAWSHHAISMDPSIYGQKQVWYQSKDGTEIPMYLVGQHDVLKSRDNPVILTSYGGFQSVMTPQFSILVAFLMEKGCVFALPSIRGGGEFGAAWHLAAIRRNRQNAFDDFLAGAQWLVDGGVAAPNRIAIFGGSNSGLLVGAAMTQAPGLFRAVVCIAPLLDMVRYHLFDGASKWQEEFGTAGDPDDFTALLAYSPYHRVSESTSYPAMMMISGDSDQKCNPLHARKMVARLQAANISSHPIILDYSRYRGHSPVLPLSIRASALTDRVAFLCDQLGLSN